MGDSRRPEVARTLQMMMRTLTHEVVIPAALRGHHEVAEEPVGQQHLHLLVVAGQVALGVVALVRIA